jgi:glycerate 2-kinase
MAGFLRSALAEVDPERLTQEAVPAQTGPVTVIAIGKAAPGMSRGAARRLQDIRGVCITTTGDRVPRGLDLIVGDHPIPGRRSLEAGRRALEAARDADGGIVALISGGGSALCEQPIKGVSPAFVRHANERLLHNGASIDEINLVRRHVSEVKNGGLARRATVPVATYVISDVCDEDVAVVASGPTIYRPLDPPAAVATMSTYGIDVPPETRNAILGRVDVAPAPGEVTVLADGHTATTALMREATAGGVEARTIDGWITGDVEEALDEFLRNAGPGLTVGAGEPDVVVRGAGKGGRNTHTALLAATRLSGSDAVFGAFATDGSDGNSESAGAIVDGQTVERGGDPHRALEAADTATYLAATGDLFITGSTGTNVADVWALWR